MSGQTIGATATTQNSTTKPVRTRSWNISGSACSAAPSQMRNLGVRLKARSAKTTPIQHAAHMNFQLILIFAIVPKRIRRFKQSTAMRMQSKRLGLSPLVR